MKSSKKKEKNNNSVNYKKFVIFYMLLYEIYRMVITFIINLIPLITNFIFNN
jgi:hypothetical protein